MSGADPVDHFRCLPARLEMRPECQTEARLENDADELGAAQVQDRLLPPGWREQHVQVGITAYRRRRPPLAHELLDPVVAVGDQSLGWQTLHLLAPADFPRLVRTGT